MNGRQIQFDYEGVTPLISTCSIEIGLRPHFPCGFMKIDAKTAQMEGYYFTRTQLIDLTQQMLEKS